VPVKGTGRGVLDVNKMGEESYMVLVVNTCRLFLTISQSFLDMEKVKIYWYLSKAERI